MNPAGVVLRHAESLAHDAGAIPHLSLHNGISGVAYAAHLLARPSSRVDLDIAADDMMQRALRFVDVPEAFALRYPDAPLARFASGSILHGPIGCRMVAALTGWSAGRAVRAASATDLYLAMAEKPYVLQEFAFGSAGPLWGCSVLLRAELDARSRASVEAAGRALLEKTWHAFADERGDNLGFAHGRAGVLYAVLAFCRDARCPLPPQFREELDDVACLADVTPRGASWPARIGAPDAPERWWGQRESWCNGASGFVPLWSLAFDVLGHPLYRELALKTAAYIVQATGIGSRSLCCGAAGHAVALRYAQRLEPEAGWSEFADDALAACGIATLHLTAETDSLFQGFLGALLGGIPWL